MTIFLATIGALGLIGLGIIIATLARMPAIMNPSRETPRPVVRQGGMVVVMRRGRIVDFNS